MIERLFFEAEQMAPPGRAQFLARECAGRDELRLELERLLAAAETDRDPVPRDGYRLAVPFAGRYSVLLDSDAERYDGTRRCAQQQTLSATNAPAPDGHGGAPAGDGTERGSAALHLDLPPLAMLLLRHEPGA